MKTSLKLWAAALAVALFTGILSAADPPKPESKSWWTDFSVTPYGAVKHVDLSGKAIWGTGLDVGYAINRTVSLHLANSIYDRPDTTLRLDEGTRTIENGWLSGTSIDETEAIFRADLVRGGGKGKDRFSVFLLGEGVYDWEAGSAGFGAGGGAAIRFSRNIALEGSYVVRAFFNEPKDGVAKLGLSLKF